MLDGCLRQEQGKWRIWQGNGAVIPVESRYRIVLGVHNHGESGNLRTGSRDERIGQNFQYFENRESSFADYKQTPKFVPQNMNSLSFP